MSSRTSSTVERVSSEIDKDLSQGSLTMSQLSSSSFFPSSPLSSLLSHHRLRSRDPRRNEKSFWISNGIASDTELE